MRIVGLEPIVVHVNHRGDWVFVRVHTDDGLIGLGEASHSSNDVLLIAALLQSESVLVGEDPTRIELLRRKLERAGSGRVERTLLSAIEQALWDLLGQYLGAPIHTLFGGAIRDRIRLYANINRHVTDRTPEGFAAAAREARADGFTAVKLAPFDELRATDHVRSGSGAAWREGVARVLAVRSAIGRETELLVDCHGRMEASEAIQVEEALQECELFWLEEPVPATHVSDLEAITSRVMTPTASGETLYGIEGFAPFLGRRVVDVLMPDVKHDGGLLETSRIAAAARAAQVLIAPHNPAGPVSTAATGQVVSTVSNLLIVEYAWGEADWRENLIDPPEKIEEGYLRLPEGNGLGHRLNDAVVQAHRAELSG